MLLSNGKHIRMIQFVLVSVIIHIFHFEDPKKKQNDRSVENQRRCRSSRFNESIGRGMTKRARERQRKTSDIRKRTEREWKKSNEEKKRADKASGKKNAFFTLSSSGSIGRSFRMKKDEEEEKKTERQMLKNQLNSRSSSSSLTTKG